jgi:hypothetical protein
MEPSYSCRKVIVGEMKIQIKGTAVEDDTKQQEQTTVMGWA